MIALSTLCYILVGILVVKKVFGLVGFYAKQRKMNKQAADCGKRPPRKYVGLGEEAGKIVEDCETIVDLLKAQFEGKITAQGLMEYTVERTERLGRELEITADENFEEALRMAKERDKQLQQ